MQKLDTVWIVDDDPIFTYLTNKQLSKFDVCNTVVAFNHGATAFNALGAAAQNGERGPDLILLDINMPVMDGREFLRRVKHLLAKFTNPVRVVMLSSSIDPEELAFAQQHPELIGFIGKPLNIPSLLELLDNKTH